MVKVFYLSSESIDFEKFANKSYWYDSNLGDNDSFENQVVVDIVDVKVVDIEIVGLKANNNLGDILEENREVSK